LQLELEPWVAKINSRQSAVDVANSEKTLLAGKAIAGQKALDAAHLALDELMQTVQSKVCSDKAENQLLPARSYLDLRVHSGRSTKP
jgi:hypothetical protein